MVQFRPPTKQEPIETPPNRKAKAATPAPSRPASTASLKKQISGMLMTINLALIMIPPTRRDVLDMTEIDALATALDEQAKQSVPFNRALRAALRTGTGGSLIGIVAIVGARRAARHGMLPQEVDQELGALLARGMAASKAASVDGG